MAVEVNITKDNADYYVEAYTKEYHLDENKVVRETGTTRLCYVAGYRDYEQEETEQISVLLRLRDDIRDFYSKYPDGEVTVKLVIKEDYVNT
jgi:hypothetical protein